MESANDVLSSFSSTDFSLRIEMTVWLQISLRQPAIPARRGLAGGEMTE